MLSLTKLDLPAGIFASLEIWVLLNMNGLRIQCINLLMTEQHLILIFIDHSEVLEDRIRSLRTVTR